MRSILNVGSLLRTSEGLGIECVYLTGYTPYPKIVDDIRLPHIYNKISSKMHKTALGAENTQNWKYTKDVHGLLEELQRDGYEICALEQTEHSIPLPDYQPKDRVAIILGREVEGLDSALLDKCLVHLEIPMFGSKESFNVVQAAAMAMYHVRFTKSKSD